MPPSATQLAADLRQHTIAKPWNSIDLAELRWETRQNVFLLLCKSPAIASRLSDLIKERKRERREEKAQECSHSFEDLGFLPEETRRREDAFRAAFMKAVADELELRQAPRGYCIPKLLLTSKAHCQSAICFLLQRLKSQEKTRTGLVQRITPNSPDMRVSAVERLERCNISTASSTLTSSVHYLPPSPSINDSNSTISAGKVKGLRKRRLPFRSNRISMEDRPPWLSPLDVTQGGTASGADPFSLKKFSSLSDQASNNISEIVESPACILQGTENSKPDLPDENQVGTPRPAAAYPAGAASTELAGNPAAGQPHMVAPELSIQSLGSGVEHVDTGEATAGAVTTATAFYRQRVKQLEAECLSLQQQNGALMQEAQASSSLLEASGIVGDAAGHVDRRNLALLQRQNLMLQRERTELSEALQEQDAFSEEVAALLNTLLGTVEELAEIGGKSGAFDAATAARLEHRCRETTRNSVMGFTDTRTKESFKPLRTWQEVLKETRALEERRASLQHAARRIYTARLMRSSDLPVRLKRPSQRSRHVKFSEASASELEGLAQGCVPEAASRNAALKTLPGLTCSRIISLSQSLHYLLEGLRDLTGHMSTDDSIVARRAGLTGAEQGTSHFELAVRSVIDGATSLHLECGLLGLVVPGEGHQSKADELEEQVARLCVPGMKRPELLQGCQKLRTSVLSERLALSQCLTEATEEVVLWRQKTSRHRRLVHRLSEGMRQLWSRQEEEMGRWQGALEALLRALDLVEGSREATRVIRGQVGEGVAHLMQCLVEYRAELETLLVCVQERAQAGTAEKNSVGEMRGRLARLWEQYDRTWEALRDGKDVSELMTEPN